MIATWRLNVALTICVWMVLAGRAQNDGVVSGGLVSKGDLSKEAADGDIPEGGFNIGGIEVKGGKDWGVRIGNWMWVRRNGNGGVDFDMKPPKTKNSTQPQGGLSIRAGKDWSVRIGDWLHVKRRENGDGADVRVLPPNRRMTTTPPDAGPDIDSAATPNPSGSEAETV